MWKWIVLQWKWNNGNLDISKESKIAIYTIEDILSKIKWNEPIQIMLDIQNIIITLVKNLDFEDLFKLKKIMVKNNNFTSSFNFLIWEAVGKRENELWIKTMHDGFETINSSFMWVTWKLTKYIQDILNKK